MVVRELGLWFDQKVAEPFIAPQVAMTRAAHMACAHFCPLLFATVCCTVQIGLNNTMVLL